jgi:hypothetical protein
LSCSASVLANVRRTIGGKLDSTIPKQARAYFFSAACEHRMQMRAANSNAGPAGKERVDLMKRILKSDSAKELAIGLVERHAKLGERIARVRHQALATRLVDWICTGLDDHAIDVTLAEGNRGCQTGRTSTHNQNLGSFTGLHGVGTHRDIPSRLVHRFLVRIQLDGFRMEIGTPVAGR